MRQAEGMDIDEFVAAVEKWGRGRQVHGYRARQAHRNEDDMGAGRTALAVERDSDADRLVWATPLHEQVTAGTLGREQVDPLVIAIDRWGFGLWLAGWGGQVAPDAGADEGEPEWVNLARNIM